MGFFDVPTVERKPWGILGLILNILPYAGIGSIVAGAKDGHKNTIIRGVIQAVTGWLVIGWVWSIVDGVRIYKASATTLVEVPMPAAPPAAAAPAPAKTAAKKAPAKKAAAKKAPAKKAAKSAKK